MPTMSKIDGVVFIKKNSERLPRKNFLHFNGKPLYTVILQTLEQHPLIDKILVDSDSSEILDYVRSNLSKGIPINRPAGLIGTHISANDLIGYDIMFSNNGHFFQTHCTNPLLTPQTISTAIEKYFGSLSEYDSLFSVTKIQNRFFDEGGKPVNHKKGEVLRLQDMPPMYMENASFFIFSATSFANSGGDRIGLNPQLYPVSRLEGTDIDFEEDFLLAELLDKNRNIFSHIFRNI